MMIIHWVLGHPIIFRQTQMMNCIYIGFGGVWTGEGLTANLLYKELTSVTYSFRQECVHVLNADSISEF